METQELKEYVKGCMLLESGVYELEQEIEQIDYVLAGKKECDPLSDSDWHWYRSPLKMRDCVHCTYKQSVWDPSWGYETKKQQLEAIKIPGGYVPYDSDTFVSFREIPESAITIKKDEVREAPKKPALLPEPEAVKPSTMYLLIGGAICLVVIAIALLRHVFNESFVMNHPYFSDFDIVLYSCFVVFVASCGIYCGIRARRLWNKNQTRVNNINANAKLKTKYEDALREYNLHIDGEKAAADNKYQEEHAALEKLRIGLNQDISEYNKGVEKLYSETLELKKRFTEERDELKEKLEELYQKDVIFEKYRNFVAVSSFYEYLSSSRCERLEGPNGCYNLYESEIRQNIIISQLNVIIEQLEQIKQNQYCMYTEMTKIRRTMGCIGNELITMGNMMTSMEKRQNALMAITAYMAKDIAEIAALTEGLVAIDASHLSWDIMN